MYILFVLIIIKMQLINKNGYVKYRIVGINRYTPINYEKLFRSKQVNYITRTRNVMFHKESVDLHLRIYVVILIPHDRIFFKN